MGSCPTKPFFFFFFEGVQLAFLSVESTTPTSSSLQAEAQIKANLDLTPEPQKRAGSAHLGFKVQAEPSLTQTRAWLGYHA